jgi:hypothetical protein
MSIRLDPRRLGVLKRLAGDAGVRPGDLVRVWVEERLDAERGGGVVPPAGGDLRRELDVLIARVEALEAAGRPMPAQADRPAAGGDASAPEPEPVTDEAEATTEAEPAASAPAEGKRERRRTKVAARPKEARVPLHEEIIAVIRERGPMTAGDIAVAIAERERYAPPRSDKPLDAAMVSQRVSNPTYRSRFTRSGGRIGLAE